MKDKARPTRRKDDTDKRKGVKVRKADERPPYPGWSDIPDNLSPKEWLAEANARHDAYMKKTARWRARIEEEARKTGVADNIWMDETDIMAALIEEVDARREAEEAKKNEK